MTEIQAISKLQEKPKLIIDTNAFIKCLDLNKLAQSYDIYTSDMVLFEIKDKKAKEKFSHLLFEIKTKFPSKTALSFAKNFAQKTGDFVSLSETDLEIIAIGYTFAEERGKVATLRKNPPEPQTYHPSSKEEKEEHADHETKSPEESYPKNEGDDWKNEESSPKKPEATPEDKTKTEELAKGDPPVEIKKDTGSPLKQQESHLKEHDSPLKENESSLKEHDSPFKEHDSPLKEHDSPLKEHDSPLKGQDSSLKEQDSPLKETENPLKEPVKENENDDSDDEDADGWINPDNFSQHFFTTQKVADSENSLGIAIMTSDFAMQNVILQIGIPLLSLDGLTIKQTKKWIFECYSCYNLCKVMNREFCPSCGNHTLSKLSCSINADGTYYIYRKANYRHKTRGLIYSIPKPQGGRNNNDLLLREDEFMLKKRNYLGNQNKDKKRDKAAFDKAQRDFENGLGFEIIRQEKHRAKKLEFGYGKHNPNERNTAKKH